MKEPMKTGVVRTNKVGSDCEFDICTLQEWKSMTEEEQEKALMDAMWESGVLDVFSKEDGE